MNQFLVELLRILRGARNGFVYASQVRFMHSLVMLLLFGKGNLRSELLKALRNAIFHGKKIALFVALFKTLVLALESVSGGAANWQHFVAGAAAGGVLFRGGSPIEQQILLYLLGRVLTGGVSRLQSQRVLPNFDIFSVLAVGCWGLVMYLFRVQRSSLQPSLASSMDFLYEESRTWRGWADFVPFKVPRALELYIEGVADGMA